jgi:predicted Fe-Mo cluster-binding NifX family protein
MLHTLKHSSGAAIMTANASALRVAPIAVLVMGSDGATTLCPFFGKCDGILLVDFDDGSRAFVPNERRTAEALCDAILKSGADQLVCGFISEPEKRKLRVAGIDVRLGSCTCSVDELAACFYDLPKA